MTGTPSTTNCTAAQFLDALRALLKATYDYVLIDSRTGLSDIADICTLHLPDMVVDCFTLSTQGIEGAAKVAAQIQGFNRTGYRDTARAHAYRPLAGRQGSRGHGVREASVRGAARGHAAGAAKPVLGRRGGAVPAGVRV